MTNDDDLIGFDEIGLTLPPEYAQGRVENAGASIWYADYGGSGRAVILLHGGMGNSGNFGKQVPDLRAAGYRVVAIDSRGQGRSSRDS
jgi:pimeloyl-ACP methyl ester carboxylesterase